MSEEKKKIINGVEVIEDGDVIHFVPVEEDTIYISKKDKEEKEEEKPGFWKRLVNWFKNGKVTPYVKVRDAADPFGDRDDFDAGSDGKSGIEAGIKIRF